MVVQICNPRDRSWKIRIQQPSEFENNLSFLRPCFKKIKTHKKVNIYTFLKNQTCLNYAMKIRYIDCIYQFLGFSLFISYYFGSKIVNGKWISRQWVFKCPLFYSTTKSHWELWTTLSSTSTLSTLLPCEFCHGHLCYQMSCHSITGLVFN